jgi:hypothetical protein
MTAISARERLRPYIADALEARVLRLPAGSTTPTELSFTDLHKPWSVAVDSAGSVYVIDVNSDIGIGREWAWTSGGRSFLGEDATVLADMSVMGESVIG